MTENLIPLTDVSASAEASGDSCCGGGGCCGSATSAQDASAAVISTEYLVNGMTCGHCVSSVTEELSELPGVTAVSVQLDPNGASLVTVSGTLPLHRDEVSSAISEAGYSLAR